MPEGNVSSPEVLREFFPLKCRRAKGRAVSGTMTTDHIKKITPLFYLVDRIISGKPTSRLSYWRLDDACANCTVPRVCSTNPFTHRGFLRGSKPVILPGRALSIPGALPSSWLEIKLEPAKDSCRTNVAGPCLAGEGARRAQRRRGAFWIMPNTEYASPANL